MSIRERKTPKDFRISFLIMVGMGEGLDCGISGRLFDGWMVGGWG